MSDEIEEDEIEFGKDRWVYCASHVNPHMTGWCSVSVKNKTLLNAMNREDAIRECQEKGYPLYKG